MSVGGWRILKGVLVVLSLGVIGFGGWFANMLTTTRPASPQGELTIPWATHGGTVFISATDQLLLYLDWTLAGVVLVTYWLGALAMRNRKKARG